MANPPENNPRVIFERMFGDGGTAAQRLAQLRQDYSILDGVNEEIGRLESSLGASDRRTINEYTDTIRDIERRIQKAEEQNSKITVPQLDKPVGVPEKFESHIDLLFDLQVLAYQAAVSWASGHIRKSACPIRITRFLTIRTIRRKSRN
jgi:hypothetical protein